MVEPQSGAGRDELDDYAEPEPEPEPEPELEKAGERAAPRPARSGWRRRAPRVVPALAVVAIAIALAVAWESVVAPLMYSVRQHHLAADLSVGRKFVADGQALAVLQIPAINLNEVVTEGASVDNLRAGPTHVAGTVLPGAAGTSVIVGRSIRYGAPFADLDHLKPGDMIVVKARANPATAFAVANVEHRSRPGTLDLDAAQPTLVLATGDGGLLSHGVVVVTATAAAPTPTDKVTTAAAPLHGPWALEPSRGSLFWNREAALLYAAIIGLVLTVRFLSQRVRTATTIAVVVPLALLVFVLAALEIDRLLPPLR
jgi:sortase A